MTKSLIRSKELSRPGPGHVPASVARELLRIIDQHDGDSRRFLRMAGLRQLLHLLDEDGPEVIARHDFTLFYARATATLDAHAARQEGRDPLTKTGVDMMCHAIITCRTLRDVISRLARFSELLAPRTGALTLAIFGDEARLTMATLRNVRNGCSYLSDLTGLASYHRLLGWLIGEDIPLSGVALRYPPLLSRQTVAYLLPHTVQHHAPENAVRFPALYLDRPVVRNHHELDGMLARFPFDIEEPQSKAMPLSERISHLFSSMLASGEALPTAGMLARQFSISLATLKRRLEAEGTSLSHLKATARHHIARRLLADPRLSITEIARRTRFSDATAFRRAFRQWTGQSPSRWRETAAN
ncbi:AraC-like DNA-binding protein [Sphingobium sp. OAS761]|nr:AraC-like DNA-binding protein [Sphingobium sp. OAS761]